MSGEHEGAVGDARKSRQAAQVGSGDANGGGVDPELPACNSGAQNGADELSEWRRVHLNAALQRENELRATIARVQDFESTMDSMGLKRGTQAKTCAAVAWELRKILRGDS
jgi:hypothetical protein